MAADRNEEKTALYRDVNEELRRFYDYISTSFEHVRNISLALLVGEVAIVTFLFSGDMLHLSKQPAYGIVVFGLGIALLTLAFAMYLAVISTIKWVFPTEDYDMKNPSDRFKDSPLEFQMYLHNEYMVKIRSCMSKISRRSRWFMYGTYSLSVGVFLIILVKYGGGA